MGRMGREGGGDHDSSDFAKKGVGGIAKIKGCHVEDIRQDTIRQKHDITPQNKTIP